jgi:hypothetical protein
VRCEKEPLCYDIDKIDVVAGSKVAERVVRELERRKTAVLDESGFRVGKSGVIAEAKRAVASQRNPC